MAPKGPSELAGQELAEHFRHIEVMAGVGSWSWNPKRACLWWSPGMHQIFGIPPERFDGRQETLFESALPEDRHILTEAAKRYENTAVPELLKYRITRPDGVVRHVWAYGENATSPEGEAIARGYVLDVTDRVTVEATLREQHEALAMQQHARLLSMVEGAPLPAMLHAEDGEVILVNERWTELTGYVLEEIPTIHEWTRLAYGEGAGDVRRGIDQLYDLEGTRDEGEFELTTKSGEVRHWLFSSAPVGVLDDGRKAVVSMAQDLTSQRRLEKEQRDYERQMHQAQKLDSLGVLAGGIAHDFNNLLTGVLGNAGLALDEAAPDSKLRTLIQEVLSAAEQAAALSRDMLTYAGKQEPPRRPVAVDEVIRGLYPLLRASTSHRIEIELALDAGDAMVLLGPNELTQVVMNLTSNAADASGPSSARVRIRTGHQELVADDLTACDLRLDAVPGRFVYVEVQDDGEGMDAETAARVFEPFFTTRSQGRGLGMAVILGVLRGAGGAAQVETRPGGGTRLRLWFPESTGSQRPRGQVSAGAAGAADPVRRQGGRVLLVDDEPMVLRAVGNMLRAMGYEVIAAAGGAEGLERHADQGPFDLALVDLTMPEMDGGEVLRVLKERDAELPVIMTTGYSETTLRSRGLTLQDALLTKPFRLRALTETLEKVLGR